MDHASSERKAFDDTVLRVAELWVCGRSGPAPYQRTTSTGAGSGGEGGEDRFNRGFEEHLRGWEGWLAVKQVRRRARRLRRDDRLLGLVIGRQVSRRVELLHGGGGLVVGQWQNVAVDPQRGGGVAVPEAVLGLQDVALGYQSGGHGVTQTVEGDVRVAGVGAQFGEPLREAGRGQSGGVVGAAGEQPRSESLALAGAFAPLVDGVPPQGRGWSGRG